MTFLHATFSYGQLTKLQCFEMGIKVELSTDDDQATYLRCQKAADRYTEWRGSFQREKEKALAAVASGPDIVHAHCRPSS